MSEEIVEQGVHNYSGADTYIAPTDPLLKERLEWFQDQKLALMMHWGPYSQLGLVESWALSDEDADWSRTGVDWGVDGETFKAQYRALNKTFNPVRFEPEKWAALAKEGGFKYLVFTTKHHDGFCMWDSAYSDYKTTAEDCPYHTHPNADIVGKVFDAFRAEGLGIAAYFSKADWHTETYWAPGQKRTNPTWRGPSYVPAENPALWEQFVQFTHNQVLELATKYGSLDVLWFDAGWVRATNGQDIRIEEMMDKVRAVQPWVLSADRTCGGICENYVTPEQCVPEKPLGIPWESCVTMGTSFSFAYEDDYKSVRQLVHLLMDIVSKGGNLALNVGPQPDGRLPRLAIERIKGLGEWLKVYSEGVYGTRVCAPYRKDGFAFTQKQGCVYAFRLYEDESQPTPEVLIIPYAGQVNQVTDMATGEAVPFINTAEGVRVTLPVREKSPIADGFVLEA